MDEPTIRQGTSEQSMKILLRTTFFRPVAPLLLFAMALGSGSASAAFLQDSSPQHLLSIEVENFTTNTPRGGDAWVTPTVPIGGFSGAGDLRAEPDNGGLFEHGYADTAPELSFDVQMVTTGTHYVHYRAHAPNASSDSLHIGFDRQEGLDTEDYGILRTPGYTWSNGNRVIEVDSVGTHSLQIWMREDGIFVDKIVLTTDPNWEPSLFGPPESPGGDDAIPTLNPIGDQTIAEGANLSFTLIGSDDNGFVTFSAQNLPNGAVLDPNTGVFDWTPAPGQARDYLVTFTAIDSANQTSSEEITISVTGSGVCFYKQEVGGDFLLTIEAEHFPTNTPLSGDAWEAVVNHPAGFSGPGLMQTQPDDGDAITINYHNVAPELSANADFTATGTHYVWVRGRGVNGSGNSLHAGLDDQPFLTSRSIDLPTGSNLDWSDGSHIFPVGALGVHSVEAWMREDGAYFDKIVVTNNPSYVPTGVGPLESSCGPLGDALPVLLAIGDKSTEVGAPLSFTVVATDDVSTPVYSVTPPLPGATFNTSTGVFAWTPAVQDEGVYSVTFRATDSSNQITEETIEITVSPDAPPVLDPIGPQSATEAVLLSFTVTASDGGGAPTLSATNVPAGATFTPASGLFEWTPISGDAGTYDVTFTATDNFNQTDDEIVTITVSTDQPPVLNPIGPQGVLEGALLEFTVTATDDVDTPVLSATGTPSGATFSPSTGVFSWIPDAGSAGTVDVTFRATDSLNQFIEEVVTITVSAVGSCSYNQSNNGDFLLVIEAENFPSNISRLGDTWQVPSNPVQGFSGVAAMQTLPDDGTIVTSNYAQTSPELSVTGNFATTGVHYVWVRGHGVKGSSDSLHIGIDGTEVATSAGITIPRTSGYEWSSGDSTLNVSALGVHSLQAWMREDGTYFDKIVLTTNANYQPTGTGPAESICGVPGDFPPILEPIGPQSVIEAALLNFTITASDDNGSPVLSATGLPAGATFTPATGVFDWTPDLSSAGIYNVTFVATDSANQTDSEVVTITVVEDAPPVLDAIGSQSVVEENLLSFMVTASDDSGVPVLSATGLPAGASFVPATGVFSWVPSLATAGTFNVTFTATDSANQTADEIVVITVSVDQPPVLAPIGPQTASEGLLLEFTVTGTDDVSTPTLSAVGLPVGATFTAATGVFGWTPGVSTSGVYNVTFIATDSSNQTDDEVVVITVGDDAPPVLASIGPQNATEGFQLAFTASGTDDNGTPLLSATDLPAGASFIPATGEFSWTPGAGTAGVYNVTFTATDSANQTDDEVVAITVSLAGVCSFQQESNGSFLLSIEAENFPTNVARAGDEWQIPNSPVAGFSGTAALQTLPDNGSVFTSGYAGAAAEVSASAEFQVAGLHYVWVRGYGVKGGSDSMHAGIDGVESASAAGIVIPRTGSYDWSNGSHTINVPTIGQHPINIWMREDGTYFDKIVVTSDANYVPTGMGPAESVCGVAGDQPPVLNSIGPQSVAEEAQLTFTVTASDDNGAPMLAATGLPSGASFDVSTGVFDWTPGLGDDGEYTVTFVATDSANQTDTEDVVITVTGGGGGACTYQQSNSGQFLLSIEAENFQINIPRSGDTWQIPGNPVSGFSGTAAMQTLPDDRDIVRDGYSSTAAELGVAANFMTTGTHYVWVRGHGVKGGSDSVHFGIDGAEVATSRAIGIPRSSGYEWSSGANTIDVTNGGIHSLQVWMREDGTYFDKVVLTTDPSYTPSGTGPIESTCSGSSGDQPPMLDPIGPQSIQEQSPLSFTVTATDDNGTPTLSATNLPGGATFAPATGLFSWTPGVGDAGLYNVTFTATDSVNQTDDELVVITVTNSGGGDQPPTLDPIGPKSGAEEALLTFTVTASDDNGAPILSATGVPVGATFTPATGVFSWTPGVASSGTYNVTFVATDSINQTDSEVVVITISVDDPPELDPIGQKAVEETVPLSFTVTATDDDGSPALSASGVPAGASFTPATGVFEWTPMAGDSVNSPYSVTFIATDLSNQTDTETVMIFVLPQSQSPFLQDSSADDLISVEGESFHSNISRSGDTWQIPSSPVAGFSGASALQALADNGNTIASNYANTAAQLSYDIEFVTTGRHYIWVRGVGVKAGSDSVHVGLDGIESAGGTKVDIPRTNPLSYQWSDGSHFVDVNTTGLHTIDAWVREDGTYIDKIVVSTNPTFSPTGLGPQQSFRVSDCQIFPSTRIASPRQSDLQTSTTITIETYSCLEPTMHAGWGVKFELDGGLAGGGSEQIITAPPYIATFAGVAQAEHSVDVVIVDDLLVEQSGSDVTDSVSAVGVGDYYVAFGDSITFGFGDDVDTDDTSADGRNTGGGYTPILNDVLTATKGYPHTVENEGVSGDTSIDGVAGIAAVISRHPDANFYLLKFGMNDARLSGTTPSGLGLSSGDAGYAGSFKDNMQQMIDAIVATGADVALAKVNLALGDSASGAQYPNPETGARTINIIEFNLVVDELVTENALTITPPDFYDYFLLNYSTEYFDNIHPDGVGYDSMADLWADEL